MLGVKPPLQLLFLTALAIPLMQICQVIRRNEVFWLKSSWVCITWVKRWLQCPSLPAATRQQPFQTFQVTGLQLKSTVLQVWERGTTNARQFFSPKPWEICILTPHFCQAWKMSYFQHHLGLTFNSPAQTAPSCSGVGEIWHYQLVPHCLLMQSTIQIVLFVLHYSVPNYKPYLTGSWGQLYSFRNLMVKGSFFKYSVFQKGCLNNIVMFKSSASFNAIFRLFFFKLNIRLSNMQEMLD